MWRDGRERGLNIKINKANLEHLQSDDIEVESKSKWWMEKEEGLKMEINNIDKFLLTRVERYFALNSDLKIVRKKFDVGNFEKGEECK